MNSKILLLPILLVFLSGCGLKADPKVPQGDAIQNYHSEFLQEEDTKKGN